MMRIVLLGAPGSGKGTQAQRLQAKYGAPQVSSGDLLRDAVARGSELGRAAKAVMDAGRLVSDDIVLGLIRERLNRPDAAPGFILDGFPRNIEQAHALSRLLAEMGRPLDAVLLLDVRRETLMKRLAGRRVCPKCGAVYNVHSLPAGVAVCERDGAELHQRPDDKEEVIAKRLEVYEQQTRPLIEHYASQGLLRVVAGEGELDDVFERMESAALAKPPRASQVTVASAKRTRKRGASARKTRAKKSAGGRAGGKRAAPKRKSAAKRSAASPNKARRAGAKKTSIKAAPSLRRSAKRVKTARVSNAPRRTAKPRKAK